jgi:hypothetical protein
MNVLRHARGRPRRTLNGVTEMREPGTIGASLNIPAAYPALKRLKLVIQTVLGMGLAEGEARILATADRRVIDPEMARSRS